MQTKAGMKKSGGGLRRNIISEGELRARDIFELLPFENALVTLDLSGEQILKLLGVVVSGREAQSGARLTYMIKADKSSQLETAMLRDEQGRDQEIDPKATYTIVTIDYLVNVGGERYSVLREGRNTKPVGITLRDAIMDYVKSETAAAREIKPSTVPAIRGVHDAMSILSAQCKDHSRQIDGIGRRSALVIHDIKRRTRRRKLQNRVWKTLSSHSVQPRRSQDATVGQDFQQTQFRFGFGATINTLRISLIVCVVGKVLGAVEDVI